jgi:hypothetical protein
VNNFHVGLYFRALPETGGNDLVGRLSFYRDAPLPRKVAICVAGFARIGTNEKLLREISENLNMPCCVFNWAGLGNSKGDPGNFTISKALEDLQVAIEELKFMGFEEFYGIAHSFGACVLSCWPRKKDQTKFVKNIFLAPALNQKDLLRYWFARSQNPSATFEDYWKFFESIDGEEKFLAWCREPKKIRGITFYRAQYWLQEHNSDYSCLVGKNTLQIHGLKDAIVPIELATTKKIDNQSFLGNADHDFTGFEVEVASETNKFFQA